MIDKFCEYLTGKIRDKMPEVDDEQAEIIMYGIQLIVGEVPKVFSVFIIGAILGLWWQTLVAFWILLPYKYSSGGFHLKSHMGCFIATNLIYCGNSYISTIIQLNIYTKIALILINLIVGIIMVSIYAPADTENLPILTKKERRTKKILSYIFLIANMLIALVIPNKIVSNILIFGTLVQTFCITNLAYKITKNEYGYKNYIQKTINT